MAPGFVLYDVDLTTDSVARSRRSALANVATRIHTLRNEVSADYITRSFLMRERLGSTALGAGAASPHTAIDTTGLPLIQITRLREAVDFDSDDQTAIDLLMTVVGNRQNLRWLHLAIPRLAQLANSPEMAKHVREATNLAEVEEILAHVRIYTERTLPDEARQVAAR